MSDHPQILEFELWRKGEAGAEVGDHVASCAACRAELDFLERLAADQAMIGSFEAPAAFDDRMAELARGHAARVRKVLAARAVDGRRRLSRVAPWAAAAAGIAIVAGLAWLGGRGSAPEAPPAAGIVRADDVNRDGRVDVLDAFALARAVDAGEGKPAWDFNRDGAVDRADVDAVALAAVSVGGGGR
jgi:hypothetical protein